MGQFYFVDRHVNGLVRIDDFIAPNFDQPTESKTRLNPS